MVLAVQIDFFRDPQDFEIFQIGSLEDQVTGRGWNFHFCFPRPAYLDQASSILVPLQSARQLFQVLVQFLVTFVLASVIFSVSQFGVHMGLGPSSTQSYQVKLTD